MLIFEEDQVVAQYIHGSGLGADVGSLVMKESVIGSAVQASYYYSNHRGDVTAVADSSGALIVSYRYDAFGNVIEQSGTTENDIQFSSKRYNSDISLSYFGARYYVSVL